MMNRKFIAASIERKTVIVFGRINSEWTFELVKIESNVNVELDGKTDNIQWGETSIWTAVKIDSCLFRGRKTMHKGHIYSYWINDQKKISQCDRLTFM